MKGLRADVLYALPAAGLLLFIILILFGNHFEINSPFAVIGQSSKPPILTDPRKSELQSVSQSNTINSANTATSSTNTIENNTEGTEVAGEDDIFGIMKIYPTKIGARE